MSIDLGKLWFPPFMWIMTMSTLVLIMLMWAAILSPAQPDTCAPPATIGSVNHA